MSRKLWAICLACWLVLWAVLTMSNVRFDGQNILMGVLALAAGILLVLER
jgi:hypothetical protein